MYHKQLIIVHFHNESKIINKAAQIKAVPCTQSSSCAPCCSCCDSCTLLLCTATPAANLSQRLQSSACSGSHSPACDFLSNIHQQHGFIVTVKGIDQNQQATQLFPQKIKFLYKILNITEQDHKELMKCNNYRQVKLIRSSWNLWI